MSTFLFDLDQTLVDSCALLEARRNGQWAFVEANLNLIRPFTAVPPPHELPARLKSMGHKVGIVTSSPRTYAEKVIAAFGISHDGLIAYHDTQNHKPHPDPLKAALTALDADPAESCHVGDDANDHEASEMAGIVSVGAGWSTTPVDPSRAPDLLLMNPDLLLEVDALPRRQYFAVALFGGIDPLAHEGSTLDCGGSVVALGRYFTTADPRHAKSVVTQQVLKLKNDDEPAAIFGAAVTRYLQSISWVPTYIVPVPPKPGQTRNRFASVLTSVTPKPGSMVLLDGLICAKPHDNYKTLGYFDRAAAVDGAYVSNYTWNGGSILLIDDVQTSGETLKSCKKALLAAGAGEVRALVFAKDQAAIGREICPMCGSQLRIRKSVYGAFWGCVAWRKGDPSSCQYKRDV